MQRVVKFKGSSWFAPPTFITQNKIKLVAGVELCSQYNNYKPYRACKENIILYDLFHTGHKNTTAPSNIWLLSGKWCSKCSLPRRVTLGCQEYPSASALISFDGNITHRSCVLLHELKFRTPAHKFYIRLCSCLNIIQAAWSGRRRDIK